MHSSVLYRVESYFEFPTYYSSQSTNSATENSNRDAIVVMNGIGFLYSSLTKS